MAAATPYTLKSFEDPFLPQFIALRNRQDSTVLRAATMGTVMAAAAIHLRHFSVLQERDSDFNEACDNFRKGYYERTAYLMKVTQIMKRVERRTRAILVRMAGSQIPHMGTVPSATESQLCRMSELPSGSDVVFVCMMIRQRQLGSLNMLVDLFVTQIKHHETGGNPDLIAAFESAFSGLHHKASQWIKAAPSRTRDHPAEGRAAEPIARGRPAGTD